MRTDVLTEAGSLLLTGRAGRAATLLTPVVDDEPGNADAWRLLARAHLALGDHVSAIEAARSALLLDPADVESLYLVSAAYTANGRHELAVEAARAACQEDPANPRAAERLGRALLAAGRPAESERTLSIATELAGYDADLHVAHGMALFAAARPLTARAAYARALALDPGHARATLELRRLTAAERSIIDADSLVRVSDAFADSLRIPPGGRPRPDHRGALAHVAGTTFTVSVVALLVLAILATTRVAGGIPHALPLTLVLGAMVAAAVNLLTRRPAAVRQPA